MRVVMLSIVSALPVAHAAQCVASPAAQRCPSCPEQNALLNLYFSSTPLPEQSVWRSSYPINRLMGRIEGHSDMSAKKKLQERYSLHNIRHRLLALSASMQDPHNI